VHQVGFSLHDYTEVFDMFILFVSKHFNSSRIVVEYFRLAVSDRMQKFKCKGQSH